MSHFSVSKIKIKNPNTNLLVQTVKQIAKEMKGELCDSIQSMEGRVEKDFLIAFKCPSIPKGVGVKVTNGQVELVGDFWLIGHDMKKKLEAEIQKTYTAMAVAKSLQNMGYTVQAQKSVQKVVVVANR